MPDYPYAKSEEMWKTAHILVLTPKQGCINFPRLVTIPEETLTWGSVPPNIPHYETHDW